MVKEEVKKTNYEKIGVSNPARFWVGCSMVLLEVFAIYIYFLSSLNWGWLSKELVIGFSGLLILIAYNVFAGKLILKGSNDKKKK